MSHPIFYREAMLRRCPRCSLEKPEVDFTFRRDGRGPGRPRWDCYCKPCRKAYGREHYERNKSRYLENATKRTRRVLRDRMEYVVRYLATHPCVECGEGDPVVLEFDHLRDKRFDIATGVRERNWQEALDEIEKCDVVCANCHRRRTAVKSGFIRAVVAAEAPRLPLFPPR